MLLPYLFILLTVLFWGGAAIIDKIALKEGAPLSGLLIRSITVLSTLIIINLFARDVFSQAFKLPPKTIILFALSGLGAGLFGMFTYYSAMKHLPSSVVVPLCSTYPLVTALLGMLVLKEGFSLHKLIGVILIVVGIWFVK
ncbi:EamA family transporter [Candidatus Omnitrophota bacterium]